MPTLLLVRHGQSAWNLENRFTGWWDVDLTPKGVHGQRASESLEAAGLNVNKNTIPFDPHTPDDPSGLRLSSNAGTARGLGTDEFGQIGRWIGRVIDGLARRPNDNGAAEHEVLGEVQALCRRFPIYG